jgi:hypothetical protein
VTPELKDLWVSEVIWVQQVQSDFKVLSEDHEVKPVPQELMVNKENKA